MNTENEFTAVYDATYRDLLRFIIVKCGDLDDANDLLQETYVELYRALKRRPIEDAKKYLIGIAKNKLKRHYGLKALRRARLAAKSLDDEVMANLPQNDFDLERHVLDKLTAEEIWQRLEQKGPVVSKIFYLYYGEGMTIRAIAAGLELKQSTVKNKLYRTLQELNEFYTKERNE